MAELRNCPSCGEFFNYTGVREVCHRCGMNEEKIYEEVYRFLRKRENRAATIERIVEMTDATESMLHKWVRKGRLQPAMFPNLGYPCDNCGALTTKGKLCDKCTADLKQDLKTFEAATEFREAIKQNDQATYLSSRKPR
ncbi:TIGR03826 family flagellar region protein [Sporosarcina trichiuri]|uniref:TIGR03826 family flagellar region protein n=1 Tax=Sporosarcina trichiuri TaxID=3056445 RepID=UPI0025B42685|nr:TIGR03826 family flagellar region protein [Sporosarcina sp. 0.2-SM1T-5]WJY26133.1 FeoC-like transcriptional regulator [Sporosarcina sp. 0.2-SM1T-5]